MYQHEAEAELAEVIKEHLETSDAHDLIQIAIKVKAKCQNESCIYCDKIDKHIKQLQRIIDDEET